MDMDIEEQLARQKFAALQKFVPFLEQHGNTIEDKDKLRKHQYLLKLLKDEYR